MQIDDLIKLGAEIICDDINSRGSGFIARRNGLIGTNWHVVHDRRRGTASQNIRVRTYNSQEFQASILNAEERNDFAVLRVNYSFESEPTYGDFVLTKPFTEIFFVGRGLDVPDISLHRGWISAKTQKDGIDVLQIDGPINQGNSGGPVFTADGKLIGIITQTEAKFNDELLELRQYLADVQQQGSSITMFGVNPLEVFRQMIYWLNRNRNVGIGYAFSIDYLKERLKSL